MTKAEFQQLHGFDDEDMERIDHLKIGCTISAIFDFTWKEFNQ